MRFGKILVTVAVVSFLTSCASYYETVMKSSDVDLKYEAAFD